MHSPVEARLLAKAIRQSLTSSVMTPFCLFQKNFKRAIDLASAGA